tara:strand:+ start:309 stop:641 length:333 start_codon:yes stop_codon:yes gene_type:complete
MNSSKTSNALSQSPKGFVWPWQQEETIPSVLAKSKTGRLSQRAKLANIEAERAVSLAYQAEINRTKAIGDAMFKSGRALKYSLVSSTREFLLRVEAARRIFEPGYRRKNI